MQVLLWSKITETFCSVEYKLFAKVISRIQKISLAGKEQAQYFNPLLHNSPF